MRATGGGSIVITSSTAGIKGSPGMMPYVTSKHAVIGLMRSAAVYGTANNIRVNTVNPAPVETRMMRSIESGTGMNDQHAAHERIASTVPIDLETESHLVWGDLIRALVKEDWKKANAAKRRVETAIVTIMAMAWA